MNKEKAKIFKSIQKGVKEIALIESGKKKGQPVDEMIAGLIQERDGSLQTAMNVLRQRCGLSDDNKIRTIYAGTTRRNV